MAGTTEIAPGVIRLGDPGGRDVLVGATSEEVTMDLVRRQVKSHRQLPVALYQLQQGFRDELGARGGIMRGRIFPSANMSSFHVGLEDLDRFYRETFRFFQSLFLLCGLEPVAVVSDFDTTGGAVAHQFIFLTEAGEDLVAMCPSGDYRANHKVAVFAKQPLPGEPPQPLEEIFTPHCKTIQDLCNYLDIPRTRTAKATFFMANGEFLFVICRGDMEVNETKLARLVGTASLRSATTDEIRAVGAVPGYASPVGLEKVRVVVDDLILHSSNLVAGANGDEYHLRNVNYGRDFIADMMGDIVAVQEGDPCPRCGSPLRLTRGVELAYMRKLADQYTRAMRLSFLDNTGRSAVPVMGSYGIDVGRVVACVVESSHDDKGILWPPNLAPFDLHLVAIGADKAEVDSAAEDLYRQCRELGAEVLYDDRNVSPGVKFGDADLIGLPIRLTVSRRVLEQGTVELKNRRDGSISVVKLEDAVGEVRCRLEWLRTERPEAGASLPQLKWTQ